MVYVHASYSSSIFVFDLETILQVTTIGVYFGSPPMGYPDGGRFVWRGSPGLEQDGNIEIQDIRF